jgi:hypothetical protein
MILLRQRHLDRIAAEVANRCPSGIRRIFYANRSILDPSNRRSAERPSTRASKHTCVQQPFLYSSFGASDHEIQGVADLAHRATSGLLAAKGRHDADL